MCSMIHEWEIQSSNYDGEPREMIVPPVGCQACERYRDCVSIVRFAYIMDRMGSAIKGSAING